MTSRRAVEFACPACLAPFPDGGYACSCGERFEAVDGIPDMVFPRDLAPEEAEPAANYERAARLGIYDRVVAERYAEAGADLEGFRTWLIDQVGSHPGGAVLEVGCGTGGNFQGLRAKVGPEGQIVAVDLSGQMLLRARPRGEGGPGRVVLSRANAARLPFADGTFDAALNLGAVAPVPDPGQAVRELARVVRPGGRVVFGDESIPPWLRENAALKERAEGAPFLRKEVPLAAIPAEAREVHLRWTDLETLYVVSFVNGGATVHEAGVRG